MVLVKVQIKLDTELAFTRMIKHIIMKNKMGIDTTREDSNFRLLNFLLSFNRDDHRQC